MNDLISRNYLYDKMLEKEELARQRVLDTPTHSPAYLRYVAQLNERTALKHEIADAPVIEAPTWIPCSERMPEENRDGWTELVLSIKTGEVILGFWHDIETGFCRRFRDGVCSAGGVVAWMPLPEPYKGE